MVLLFDGSITSSSRARVIVDMQDLIPRQAAVGGLVDALFAAAGPQIAERRDIHDVEVHRIDDDLGDLPLLFLRPMFFHVRPPSVDL